MRVRVDCSGLPGRTSLRLVVTGGSHVPESDCSGLPGRTSLRPGERVDAVVHAKVQLFRSSRPDFIETSMPGVPRSFRGHCSGLPGRTSLRPDVEVVVRVHRPILFRSSRPDFIETVLPAWSPAALLRHCSGLPGRTSLRQFQRRNLRRLCSRIVPVFQAGLH